jgi:hypothetical protein
VGIGVFESTEATRYRFYIAEEKAEEAAGEGNRAACDAGSGCATASGQAGGQGFRWPANSPGHWIARGGIFSR